MNVGIGRELYTAPFIWVSAQDANIQPDVGRNNKYKCNDRFFVEAIKYDEKKNIVALSIKNRTTNKRVFLMDKRKKEM